MLTYTTYSSDKQYGVSINSHAFDYMCGDQFNRCVWGLNAIVTHDEHVTNTLNGVSRKSAQRSRDGKPQRVTTVNIPIHADPFANRSLRAVTSTPCFLAMG